LPGGALRLASSVMRSHIDWMTELSGVM
jgi:hypothetical protein